MANLAPAGAVSRGLALAEKHIQQGADEARAEGNTQLADAIEATITTTARQRNAALVPRQVPAYDAGARLDEAELDLVVCGGMARSMGDESDAEIWELLNTDEEIAEYNQRKEDYYQLVKGHHARELRIAKARLAANRD